MPLPAPVTTVTVSRKFCSSTLAQTSSPSEPRNAPTRAAVSIRGVVGAVVITGSSRGIGAATARLAAARGYAVVVNYRSDRAAAEALVAEIAAGGGEALAVQADVSTEAGVAGLFAAVDEWRGTGPSPAS